MAVSTFVLPWSVDLLKRRLWREKSELHSMADAANVLVIGNLAAFGVGGYITAIGVSPLVMQEIGMDFVFFARLLLP